MYDSKFNDPEKITVIISYRFLSAESLYLRISLIKCISLYLIGVKSKFSGRGYPHNSLPPPPVDSSYLFGFRSSWCGKKGVRA